MTDRIHPSKPKPSINNGTPKINPPQAFPPTKSHLYKPNRPVQPPIPRRRRSQRSCFCLCCFWSILILLILLFLIAIAACVFYLLYTPDRPSFSLNSLKISRFNLTTTDDTTHLTAAFNLTISAKNSNKRIAFFYDHISIAVQTSNELVLAKGSFPDFQINPENTTVIRSHLSTAASEIVDADSLASLRSDLKKKNGIPLEIVMDTGLVLKIEGFKTKRILIRITCKGIHGGVSTVGSKCTVDDVRIKIWKWTV